MLALAGPVVLAEIGWVTMGTRGHHHRRAARARRPSAPSASAASSSSRWPSSAWACCSASTRWCRTPTAPGAWTSATAGSSTASCSASSSRRCSRRSRWRWHRAPAVVGICSRGAARSRRRTSSVITWSLLPLLLYASFRRYLQALGIVRADHGRARHARTSSTRSPRGRWSSGTSACRRWARPGSAVATLVSRIYLAAALLVAVVSLRPAASHQRVQRAPGGRSGAACRGCSGSACRRRRR